MKSERATSLAGYRVLVVEDEMLVAMSIEDALVEAGCEVVGPAATVEKALALVDGGGFDSAVLDMNLDGRSGMPVADALAGNSIPFLVLSGYGAVALSGLHRQAPVLSKPFDSVKLTDALRRLIQARESPDSA